MLKELCDESLGLGPLEDLIANPEVSEIMVVDPQTIFAEVRGRIQQTPYRFTDSESVRSAMQSVKERAQGQVLPIARNVFDKLTPEQKDKLRAAAERHGRTFDPERATQRIGRMLARPRAVEFLEARGGR